MPDPNPNQLQIKSPAMGYAPKRGKFEDSVYQKMANPNFLQMKHPVLPAHEIEHVLQLSKFENLIYRKIERFIPTTSTSDMEMNDRKKTVQDVSRAKKIISRYVIEVETLEFIQTKPLVFESKPVVTFFLLNPETGLPAYIFDLMGGIIKYSWDDVKWDVGVTVSRQVKNAGDYLVGMAERAKSQNRLNPRYDKYHRNPYIIRQNKAVGTALSKSGKFSFKVFKILSSKAFGVFNDLFFDLQSLGRKVTAEDEFEDAVIRELIRFCNENVTK